MRSGTLWSLTRMSDSIDHDDRHLHGISLRIHIVYCLGNDISQGEGLKVTVCGEMVNEVLSEEANFCPLLETDLRTTWSYVN